MKMCFDPHNFQFSSQIATNDIKIKGLTDLISEQQVQYTYQNIETFKRIADEENKNSSLSSELWQDVQRRIKDENFYLSEINMRDRSIIEFIYTQKGTCLKPLLRSMSVSQQIALFLYILNARQTQKLFSILACRNNNPLNMQGERNNSLNVQIFQKVHKAVRPKVWEKLGKKQQINLLFTVDEKTSYCCNLSTQPFL